MQCSQPFEAGQSAVRIELRKAMRKLGLQILHDQRQRTRLVNLNTQACRHAAGGWQCACMVLVPSGLYLIRTTFTLIARRAVPPARMSDSVRRANVFHDHGVRLAAGKTDTQQLPIVAPQRLHRLHSCDLSVSRAGDQELACGLVQRILAGTVR